MNHGYYVTAEIWIKERNGEIHRWRSKHKIFTKDGKHGVVVKDGTPVEYIDGKWVYVVIE